MKIFIKILSIIFTQILTINCSAQHIQDPNADKFAGTWKWGDNTNGLTLIMKKENNMKILGISNPERIDGIIGFQKLIKNGLITEDTTMFHYTNFDAKKHSFKGATAIKDSNPNLLLTWGRHKNKSVNMKIEYIDSNHIKIIEVTNIGGVIIKYPGDAPTDWSIDIPTNIILTKQ